MYLQRFVVGGAIASNVEDLGEVHNSTFVWNYIDASLNVTNTFSGSAICTYQPIHTKKAIANFFNLKNSASSI